MGCQFPRTTFKIGIKMFRIISVTLVVFASLFIGCREVKYKTGRDTIRSFGDGRYQILSMSGTQVLYDIKQQKEILRDVTNWLKSDEEIILIAGHRGPFAVIHLDSNIVDNFLDIKATPVRLHPLLESLINQ